MIHINTYVDFKYIAKYLILMYEVIKKLLSCAQFRECALCGDKARTINNNQKLESLCGRFYRIEKFPDHIYYQLYHTLFESH